MNQPNAVILGAGLAGLATALRLAEGGRYHPLLLEREERPGGLARSLRYKEFASDMGPHRIHTELAEVQRLIDRVAAPSLMTVPRQSHIYIKGKYLPYPPSPLAMAMHLGPLRMARFAASFAAERLRPAARPEDETYESLMRRAFGKALYDFLLRPYSAKTWKIDPAELHADTARVRVSAGSLAKMVAGLFRREKRGQETSLKQFQYVRGGAETLARHLWEHARELGAEIKLNSSITGLELGVENRILAAQYNQRQAEGEVFVSTLPLPLLLGRLLPNLLFLTDAREAAMGLQYLDIIFVCLIVRRSRISGDNWLYYPEPHLIFNRAYEAKSFDAAMGPEGYSVFCLEITHRAGDTVGCESDASLIQTVTKQIASTGLFGANEVAEGVVFRTRYAYPLYTLDYAERLGRALAGLRRIPNLLTLGRQGLFNHNNMDHSIYMGLEAADLLNAQPASEAVQRWYDQAERFKIMRIVD